MREDDFSSRSKHLQSLSDEELNQRFWELAGRVIDPLVDLATTNTSPSIERSVLLRMGFNSLQAKALVERIFEKGLLGKGAGHIVWAIAKEKNEDYMNVGRKMIDGAYWDDVDRIFKGVKPV
jgi:D-ornithine 4,5-aminomutase subunit alpha